MDSEIFSFTMASGDPGTEDLGASSLFRAQLDITVIDAPISCKIHFDVLLANCSTVNAGAAMGEGDFTGTGLNLGTATWDPGAGDRYQIRVLATNSEGHTGPDGTLTLRTNNANAFFEIPDAPAAGGLAIPIAFYHLNHHNWN
jgi:hypothetical protein